MVDFVVLFGYGWVENFGFKKIVFDIIFLLFQIICWFNINFGKIIIITVIISHLTLPTYTLPKKMDLDMELCVN